MLRVIYSAVTVGRSMRYVGSVVLRAGKDTVVGNVDREVVVAVEGVIEGEDAEEDADIDRDGEEAVS